MVRRQAALLVLAIMVAALAAGCGGGNGGDANASQTLTWPQFVKKANASCREERIGVSKEASTWLAHDRARGFPHDVLLWRMAHYVLLPHIEHEVRKILSFNPPSVDKAGVDAAFSAERVAVDRVANAGRLPSVAAFHNYFAESAAELRANGLTACTND